MLAPRCCHCRLVPFNTTSSRSEPGVPGSMKGTPGPGEYTSSSWARGSTPTQRASGQGAAAAFSSKTSRDAQYAAIARGAEAPGPGQYKLPSDFESHRRSRRGAQSAPAAAPAARLQPKRNPPSIPAWSQSYGYEETDLGELVMQRAPKSGFSGVSGRQSAGPGAYDPDTAMKWTRPSGFATAWGNSRVQRRVFDAAAAPTPGPGAYAPRKEDATRSRGKQVLSSAFASRVPLASMSEVDSEKVGPGPGEYGVAGGIRAPVVARSRQMFGSSSKRSTEPPANHDTPGPGHYTPQTLFGERSRHDPAAENRVASAFSSSSVRFKKLEKVREPGPGAYDEYDQHSLAAQIDRKTHGRNGAFGSTSRRFASARVDPTPGAGAYDPAPAEAPRDEQGANAVFASATERFDRKAPPRGPRGPVRTMRMEPSPGPMQYAVKPDNAWNRPKPAGGDRRFGSSVERFPDNQLLGQPVAEGPGPSAYSPKAPNGRKPTAASGDFGKQGRFGPRAHRFIPHSSTPGPGQYEAASELAEPFIKRSFNITLG